MQNHFFITFILKVTARWLFYIFNIHNKILYIGRGHGSNKKTSCKTAVPQSLY